jgi:hypothetical protein
VRLAGVVEQRKERPVVQRADVLAREGRVHGGRAS